MTRRDWTIVIVAMVLLACLVALPDFWAGSLGGDRPWYIGDVPTRPAAPDGLLPGGR